MRFEVRVWSAFEPRTSNFEPHSFILHLSSFILQTSDMSLSGLIRLAFKSFLGGAKVLQPGDRAPDFDVLDHNGNRVKLSDLRGKKVVLWFYPKASTPG